MLYAKLIDGILTYPPKNKDRIVNYDKNIELLIQDGYKEFIEAQKEPEKEHIITYLEEDTRIIEHAEEIIPDPAEILRKKKEEKIQENDTKRDTALNQGVIYREVLFDSDTDQKVNLLATVSMMSDSDTVVWFGMDNVPLECTKEDLINIGSLITQLHTFCWNKNAEIKEEINNALTVEEVERIEINYEF